MAFNDFFTGEIATELLKQLVSISRKSCLCKSTADNLITSIQELLPIIDEIKYSGVELPAIRQSQLDRFSETLRGGLELARKVLASGRWNVYKNLQLARKMEKLEKQVARFVSGPLQAHLLADVHHMRFETMERFDRLEGRLEQRLSSMKIGVGGWVEEAVKRMEVEEEASLGILGGVGLDLGKSKVKKLLMGRDDLNVVGICGIGGSGKTTLANEICRDNQVRSYFNNRILFLTVSQSPDLDQLRAKIWGFITGNEAMGYTSNHFVPPGKLQCEWGSGPRILVVLDDVWSLSALEQLIFRIPAYKTLVVSRFKFPTSVVNEVYKVELLREDESMSLFCHSAFGQKSIPPTADESLVKQIVSECKGLPLALKVIGASLRDQPEMYWASAKKRLLRGEPICESHENKLLERMAISVEYLNKKVKQCFLDLGSFPEDKKIPLDVLINMWVEIHDIDEEEAFAILVELSDKNLLTLVKDPRAGDAYSSFYEICVTQHDVLRDLALHLSNRGDVNERKRLLMPRRDTELPRDWERNADQPFNAQIVSVHTGEMREMDWFRMEFPKAEVLILNFSSNEYFLPPFTDDMPKLRALVVINYGTSEATLQNFSVFTNLANLRSLWLEKVSVPQLSNATVPLRNLRKLSMVFCKVNNSFDPSVLDLPQIFPRLSELVIDHCDDLIKLPLSICKVNSLQSLSITNCHRLCELPADLGMLRKLQILRLYACPELKKLPPSIGELVALKYLDISQCLNMRCLPREIGRLSSLEKIDMRECSETVSLPTSAALLNLKSLRRVICDDEVSGLWKNVGKAKPDLHVQVAERSYSLDWLDG
ncbi:PREDICTED: probable disease resistance protein At4g33300 [Theobroma cacao]|uniref:Probable disease resistance protein At4g33300 n=1 Tax=Theobroma cacao TaxID=3641 RepID=A0AB32UTI9_THECC|nr:PREDICTED: probable disease resistance protein At4g33300 [Theobroma cacao]